MKKKKKILLLAAAVCLLIAVGVCLASCGGSSGEKAQASEPIVVGTEKVTYTVTLKTEGGKALTDVGVFFYTDSTMAELVWFAKTDANGCVSFTDLESNGYVAVLDKVPDGYKVEPFYRLSAQELEIVLATDMADGDLASLNYKLGDVMMNFSVTDVDGKMWVLSDLLAEKQAVVLNFWYLQCAPCKMEFPFLQEAYEKYSDKIALVAMNPINDSREEIAAYAVENGLTFPMAHCDPAWEKAMGITAYPTTVIIDRFGTIALIHKGGIEEAKVFEDAFEFFTADDYEQTTVEDIMDLEIKAAGTDSSNPVEIGGKLSFEVTIGPGQKAYYSIYRVDGMTLTVNNTHISAECDGGRYPSGSGLSFPVKCPDTYTPAKVVFGNDSEETQTFTVRLTPKAGTVDNPVNVKLGEFSVSVQKGNAQGVYHSYTPSQDGMVTVVVDSIEPADVRCGVSLTTQKGVATIQRTLEEDGDSEKGSVSISVKKGVKVQIIISTIPDETNTYPAATIKCTLSIGEDTTEEEELGEGVVYAVTVTDDDRNPISGVNMTIKGETPEDGSKAVSERITTNSDGVAASAQDAGEYTVTLTVPRGYGASTTRFTLNEESPYASVRLYPVKLEMKTYSVTVVDEAGAPVSDAMVMIGSEYRITDGTGKISVDLLSQNYTAYVTRSGSAEVFSFPFEGTATELTAVLGKSGSGSQGSTSYTVTVKDYNDKNLQNVAVMFLEDGIPVAAQRTNVRGRASAKLPKGDYTVDLAFNGNAMYYEAAKAVFDEGTSLTIKVAPGLGGEYKTLYVGDAYYLQLGPTYVQMQADVINYYIFEPTVQGRYEIRTSDPQAVLSYQGSSLAGTIEDRTHSTDYDPDTNIFTQNIKESHLGNVVIIGVTGAEETIIEIVRLGDAILDETDIPYTEYVPAHQPTAFTLKEKGKLTYLDMSADTDAYDIVLGDDGFYHLGSPDGELLYVNLGPDAPHQCLYYVAGAGATGVAGVGIKATIRDEETGEVIIKHDFSQCVRDYGDCMDAKTGVYPLTEDLKFIIQTAGEYYGWWDSNSTNFWLNSVEDLNPELGWLFAVCYVKG